MRSREPSVTDAPVDRGRTPSRRSRRLGLAGLVLAGAMALAAAVPAGATVTQPTSGCGWNKGTGLNRPYYEHCAKDTNVWIKVTRRAQADYHRCVGPGTTQLDRNATGAWYDSGFRGGLCSHPGDTG